MLHRRNTQRLLVALQQGGACGAGDGFARIITYILDSEDGASLVASGWRKEADIRGHKWGCPSRPRQTSAPACDKQRWVKVLTDNPAPVDFPKEAPRRTGHVPMSLLWML